MENLNIDNNRLEIIKKINQNYGNLIGFEDYVKRNNYFEVYLNYVAPIIIKNEVKNFREKRLEFLRFPEIGKMTLDESFTIIQKTEREDIIKTIKKNREYLILKVESYLLENAKANIARIPYLNIRFNPVKVILNSIIYEDYYKLPHKIKKKYEYIKYSEYCNYLEEFKIIRKDGQEYYAGNLLTEMLNKESNVKNVLEICFAEFLVEGQKNHNLIRKNYSIIIDVLDVVYYFASVFGGSMGVSYESIKANLKKNLARSIEIDDLISKYVPELKSVDLLEVTEHLCYPNKDILQGLINNVPKEQLLVQTTL